MLAPAMDIAPGTDMRTLPPSHFSLQGHSFSCSTITTLATAVDMAHKLRPGESRQPDGTRFNKHVYGNKLWQLFAEGKADPKQRDGKYILGIRAADEEFKKCDSEGFKSGYKREADKYQKEHGPATVAEGEEQTPSGMHNARRTMHGLPPGYVLPGQHAPSVPPTAAASASVAVPVAADGLDLGGK